MWFSYVLKLCHSIRQIRSLCYNLALRNMETIISCLIKHGQEDISENKCFRKSMNKRFHGFVICRCYKRDKTERTWHIMYFGKWGGSRLLQILFLVAILVFKYECTDLNRGGPLTPLDSPWHNYRKKSLLIG